MFRMPLGGVGGNLSYFTGRFGKKGWKGKGVCALPAKRRERRERDG